MKTKHTATPWRLAHDGATIHCGSEHDPEIVCSCDINDPMVLELDDQEANAQFITLACNHHEELIAVLTDCLQSLERLPDTDGAYRVTCIQQAKSLLTKLKG